MEQVKTKLLRFMGISNVNVDEFWTGIVVKVVNNLIQKALTKFLIEK